MMPNFICAADDQSFDSLEKLEEHEKSGHVIKGINTKNQEINPELAETLKQIREAEKAKEAVANKQAPEGTELKLPDPTPLKLEYNFTGTDPAGHPVTTLEIEINESHFVIGYCNTERKQIVSHQVRNLEDLNLIYYNSLKKEEKPAKIEPTTKKERK